MLDQNLRVEDLKAFNRYIIHVYSTKEMGDDVELLDVDENIMEKIMLESVVGKQSKNQTPIKPVEPPALR